MIETTEVLSQSKKLDAWLAEKNWKAYDPFDGLNAKGVKALTFDNHFLRIVLQQTVRRFPLNLRPLLGVKPETSSKGMGFCALGYLKLYRATGEREYLRKARKCLDWLMENYSEGYAGYAWGNHFSYESRGGKIPIGVPTIVWTSLIGNVFLDAFELLDEKKYYEVARSVCDFIAEDIGYYEFSDRCICFMYTPLNKKRPTLEGCIHNSNVLGAWIMARISRYEGEDRFYELSKRSVAYTAENQLPSGGWYYGEPEKYRWIDSFHTGYVLESIHGYMEATGDRHWEKSVRKGFEYFVSTFFGKDGVPKYYNHKTYPIDIQCASQGIQTLVNLRRYDDRAIDTAKKVASWTVKNMCDSRGYYYFRKYPGITNKTPMFHWGQATMLSGLAHLYEVVSNGRRNEDKSIAEAKHVPGRSN